ncbi:MAG: ribonuclease HII [Syntrophomonadaceae bacterium]|nr:ribonuclease HII [Syntrophomonadaceae bacterium]
MNSFDEEKRILDMKAFETEAYNLGYKHIAGVDEVGRGPIAGPVVAAAVILPPDFFLPGINDSKKLTAKKRVELSNLIKKEAVDWAVSYVFPPLLDEINIYGATIKAMETAILSLKPKPDFLLIDAVKLPDIDIKQRNIIKGDSLSISIAAASIIAKVERDMSMEYFDSLYPGYGFINHKGYATKQHIEAVLAKGPCILHRSSFEPVKSILNGGELVDKQQPSLFK